MLRRHTERVISVIEYTQCQQIWFLLNAVFLFGFFPGLLFSDIDHLIAYSFCKNLLFYLINLNLCEREWSRLLVDIHRKGRKVFVELLLFRKCAGDL